MLIGLLIFKLSKIVDLHFGKATNISFDFTYFFIT